MNTELDDPESTPLPTTAAEAFDQAAAGNTLFGNPLASWTLSRKIAASAMGLLGMMSPGAGSQLRGTGIYAGALRDVIIFAWLSSIKTASELSADEMKSGLWNVQRATRTPQDAFEEATRWAEQNGIVDETGNPFFAAYRVMLSVMLGISLSEFEVEAPKDAKPTGAPTDPNG